MLDVDEDQIVDEIRTESDQRYSNQSFESAKDEVEDEEDG